MYISLHNSKGFPDFDLRTISDYVLGEEFVKQVKLDGVNKDDSQSRVIITITDNLFLIRHTDFSAVNDQLSDIHIATVERYGLFDLYQIGTDVNKNSILYWACIAKAKIIVPTYLGIVCSNNIDQSKPEMLARFDGLWISSGKTSTVLAIDNGSSHLVT